MKKIAVIGSLNLDYVMSVAHMPAVGETILADGFEMIPGGKGANQAFAAGRLGAGVVMLGAVGMDDAGKQLCDSLKSAGVCTDHLKHADGYSTGSAFITVNEQGDNHIIVAQGANKAVDCAYIDSKEEVIRACDIVIFQLEIPLETVLYAAKKAKEWGKTVILDPAPARVDLPRALLECVDILKPNETEAAVLTGSRAEDWKQSAELLQKQGAKNILITLGGDGAYLKQEDGSTRHFKAKKVKAVDTTAAGDTFTAGVAVGTAIGDDLPSAIQLASHASAIVVTRKGAQSSIPSLAEVQEQIRAQG